MTTLWWVIVVALVVFVVGLALLVFVREYAVRLRATRRGNDVDLVGVTPPRERIGA